MDMPPPIPVPPWLAVLPPPCVALAAAPVTADPDGRLFPEELELVADAVAKRRHEFAAGRGCARQALARFGLAPAPLLRAAGGGVCWPAGYCGSIAHSDRLAAAVITPESCMLGLGLDLEELGRLHDALLRRVMTPAELADALRLPEPARQLWATRVFCTKEALFKCLNPLLNHWFGFQEAEVVADIAAMGGDGTAAPAVPLALTIRLGPALTALLPAGWRLGAHCTTGDGHVAALVWAAMA